MQGVSGTWKDLTESVDVMAANLTDQARAIAAVTTAVARGDLSQKIRVDARGEILELKETINTMVDRVSAFAGEVTRVAGEVGTTENSAARPLSRGCREPGRTDRQRQCHGLQPDRAGPVDSPSEQPPRWCAVI